MFEILKSKQYLTVEMMLAEHLASTIFQLYTRFKKKTPSEKYLGPILLSIYLLLVRHHIKINNEYFQTFLKTRFVQHHFLNLYNQV